MSASPRSSSSNGSQELEEPRRSSRRTRLPRRHFDYMLQERSESSELEGMESDSEFIDERAESAKRQKTTASTSRDVQGPTRGRAVGRGRRGRRGRGGGRGGHQSAASLPNVGEEEEEEQQKLVMKDEVGKMSEEGAKNILCRVIEQQPGLMLEILRPAAAQPGGYHPPPGQNPPDWCICGFCRQMPTVGERVCCRKARCVSQIPQFNLLVLNEQVLALARLYRRDVLVFDDDADIKKANRHQAYRQFVLWNHGRLTAGDRRVIPSCSVWRIRDKFPDPFSVYRGFVGGCIA